MKKLIYAIVGANLVITILHGFKIKSIMTKQEQFDQLVVDLFEATNKVAADLEAMETELLDAGVSQESIDKMRVSVERLKALGANPADPIPEEEPPVEG